MKKEFLKYKRQYLILFSILILFAFAFLAAWPNTALQRAVAAGLMLFYFSWGVIHHRKSGHVVTKVVLEYFFASLLAGAILLLITT